MVDDAEIGFDWAGLAVMTADECFERLRQTHVGRVGFVDQGEVVILPVNIAMDGHSVVFRTGHGSKLSSALMQNPVCVEIDDWDGFEHTGWSVLAKGIAEVVVDRVDVERFEALPVRPWASPDVRPRWVRIRVDEVTGRRIVKTPA